MDWSGPDVLVTAPEYHKAEDVFARSRFLRCRPAPASEAALAAAVRRHGSRYVIVGVRRYRDALYRALPRGGVIARFGVGYDGLDLARTHRHGLYCVNTPRVLDDSVAEHAMALILAAARALPELAAAVQGGSWPPRLGHVLRGKRLTVIGCGSIGCRVARLATRGFGMRVTGCDTVRRDTAAARRAYGFSSILSDFPAAVAGADYVSLHIPASPQTRHFMDAARLRALPARSWLINTARGALVDERALYEALWAGHPAGAALDVFEHEPYRPRDPGRDLRTLGGKVIMTPHVSGSTREACARVARRCLKNLVCAERGRPEAMDLILPVPRPSGRKKAGGS